MALSLATAHLSDDEFLEALHSCRLPKEQFANLDHFRLAWLHLHRVPLDDAEQKIRSGIRGFGAHHGKVDRYHETITIAWVRLVATHTEPTFEDFLRKNEAKLNLATLYAYWTPESLASEKARTGWLPPDRRNLPPAVRVVEAAEKDVPVILEMIRGLAEYEKLGHLVVATDDKLRQTLFGQHPGAEVLLAWTGAECAGMALFFPNYSTFLAQPGLYLEDLYVKPHLRGRGAGLALLRRLAQIATERNCGRVEWEVLDWNEPSIGFYKSLGAVPLDEWTRYRLTGEALNRLAKEPQ
jgi:GNAT superfamily N-acetyltransferase